MPEKPKPRLTWHKAGTSADEQRIIAARLAMWNQVLKEALDG
jgi:hypothetical protein